MSFQFYKISKIPTSRKASRGKQGFTMLEMIVVIAIITIMTGILLGNLPGFRDHTTLQLVAQEVAVTIRQAQVFGIGTKVEKGLDGRPIYPSHGLYFCDPSADAGNPGCRKNFILFSDAVGGAKTFGGADGFNSNLTSVGAWVDACRDDGAGIANGSGECREVFTLSGNIEICEIVIGKNTANNTKTGAHVAFSRLYPDAFITDTGSGEVHSSVTIYLMSMKDKKRRMITLYNTGGVTLANVLIDDNTCIQP